MKQIEGQCLCGDVKISASVERPVLRACHCDMCQRHTSGMFVSIKVDQDSLQISGPTKSFRSSDWAERGFCGRCGSTLWYGTVEDGVKNLAAGLFPDAGGGMMTVEFFADACPSGYALAGDHKKLTTQETYALFGGGS